MGQSKQPNIHITVVPKAGGWAGNTFEEIMAKISSKFDENCKSQIQETQWASSTRNMKTTEPKTCHNQVVQN